VTLLPPHQLARRGLSRTFQNLQVFMGASALVNVMIGRHRWERTSFWADLLGLPSVWRQNAKTRDTAAALLARVGLAALAEHSAASLPYGALKRLEIARALATEPKVLLLDEPAAGCNPVETQEIDALIRAIALDGVAVVLVEHDMKLVMNVSTHVLVLNQGRKLAEGTPAVVRENPEVIAAYLGRHAAEERSAT
jgi:branched-chain amino acid transport system ATP-binding protein